MTREEREKHLDWLYRLKSNIVVFMPKDRIIPFLDALDAATKALEQEPRWIPVSERLPKVADCYDVTRQVGDDLIVSACYFDGIHNWHDDRWINYERNYLTDIVAWMPLPKPYREAVEE